MYGLFHSYIADFDVCIDEFVVSSESVEKLEDYFNKIYPIKSERPLLAKTEDLRKE
jgi:hypothetical protein